MTPTILKAAHLISSGKLNVGKLNPKELDLPSADIWLLHNICTGVQTFPTNMWGLILAFLSKDQPLLAFCCSCDNPQYHSGSSLEKILRTEALQVLVVLLVLLLLWRLTVMWKVTPTRTCSGFRAGSRVATLSLQRLQSTAATAVASSSTRYLKCHSEHYLQMYRGFLNDAHMQKCRIY